MRKILASRPSQTASQTPQDVATSDAPTAAPAPRSGRQRRPQHAAEPRERASRDRYLSVAEVAEVLGTTERFPRRLIEERRIEFKRFGRHVRIAASVLDAYIESCTVAPYGRRAA